MYVTAHRVRASTGEIGINAFLHRHDDRDYAIDWSNVDIRQIAEECNGRLLTERLSVVPGRNRVLSYLDVAAPDDAELIVIKDALVQVRSAVKDASQPLSRALATHVYVGFGAVSGLRGAEQIEFDELAAAVEDLCSSQTPAPWLDKPPIVVRAAQEGDEVTFRLDAGSAKRVRGSRDVPIPVGVVRVDAETLEGFTAKYGDVMPHVLPVATGMRLDELRLLGGVQVVRDADDVTLWAWPRRDTPATTGAVPRYLPRGALDCTGELRRGLHGSQG